MTIVVPSQHKMKTSITLRRIFYVQCHEGIIITVMKLLVAEWANDSTECKFLHAVTGRWIHNLRSLCGDNIIAALEKSVFVVLVLITLFEI